MREFKHLKSVVWDEEGKRPQHHSKLTVTDFPVTIFIHNFDHFLNFILTDLQQKVRENNSISVAKANLQTPMSVGLSVHHQNHSILKYFSPPPSPLPSPLTSQLSSSLHCDPHYHPYTTTNYKVFIFDFLTLKLVFIKPTFLG